MNECHKGEVQEYDEGVLVECSKGVINRCFNLNDNVRVMVVR